MKMVVCFICKKQIRKDLTIQLDTPAGPQPGCITHPGVQEAQKSKTNK